MLDATFPILGRTLRSQAGFFHVAFALAKKYPQRSLRLGQLLTVFSESAINEFSGFYVEGAIDNLDFSGIGFRNMRFGDMEFTNCIFDASTQFIECHFGGNIYIDDNCTDFGLAQFVGGHLSGQARSVLQRAKVNGVTNRITEDQIQDALRYVLKRFRRGEGFKTSKRDAVVGSTKNAFGFGEEVVAELIRNGVLEGLKIGSLPMLKVTAAGDLYQFMNNSYLRGNLDRAYQKLAVQLVGKEL